MEFPGVKNEVEFPGVTKKKSCGISRGLFFGLGISKGCNTNLENFQRWSSMFCLEFQRVK